MQRRKENLRIAARKRLRRAGLGKLAGALAADARLIANYDDKTALRTWGAGVLANSVPIGNGYLNSPADSPSPSGTSVLMPWAPHSLFVELFLNGVYDFRKFVRLLHGRLDGILPWTTLRLSNGAELGRRNGRLGIGRPSPADSGSPRNDVLPEFSDLGAEDEKDGLSDT
jgi:hypothetical protein